MSGRCSMGGHEIYYDKQTDQWRYKDNDEPTLPFNERPCVQCGKPPTDDGHDSCIANLGHVVNACCGHGVEEGYIQFDDGTIIRGHFTVERDVEYGKLCEEEIEFENGSTIESLPYNQNVRGKRAELTPLLFDYERADLDSVSEVLKEYFQLQKEEVNEEI